MAFRLRNCKNKRISQIMNRRTFTEYALKGGAVLSASSIFSLGACQFKSGANKKKLKISLAQWSLHRAFEAGKLNPSDFASIAAKTYSIKAVEYVNGFYADRGEVSSFWKEMKKKADDVGVESLLIMVDDEGDLGASDDSDRKKAVENHFKWVEAAKVLGCHSVRVNAFGAEDREVYKSATIDGMGRLAEFAAQSNINIIIENHGLYSSDAKLIVEIIKQVNKPNFGTFPDFGNWCLSAKWGSTQIECERVYDRYEGVAEFLPFAKAVSAKSYNFNEQGEDRVMDYYRLLKLVKDSSYDGHIGIEYEGTELSEHDGILATKALMNKVWESLD